MPLALLAVTALPSGFPLAAGSTPGASAGLSIYTCVDAAGRRHTSDRPIPECADRPMRELRSDGAIKREIEAPLTRAQREERERAQAAARVQEMRKRQQLARDRALLRTYPTLDDLYAMRDRQMAELQALVEKNYARMIELHKALTQAQARAASYTDKAAPESLKQQMARLASEILAEDALAKSRQKEQALIHEKFEGDAERLRELLEKQAELERTTPG